ncbi:sigma 54-interacting transcriptional regulator [Vagococcus fessus]|uniref:Transcription antiterminator BglG n=1 Tax=Vagococcus fessus TaxID=120370 RepID=A0A430A670_9ENTE|nr:sigma 54-interacting transcriptional regulator [Vagococcus fessus]RSU02361.1 hypothetical protein CBF31_08300 [Vagococcus fessus]
MKKNDYLDYLINEGRKAEAFTSENYKFATTQTIAAISDQKVTLVNHYLNSLFKEKKLVKINTKPVFYLPVSLLKELFGKYPDRDIFSSFKEVEKECKSNSLDQLIGAKRSLSEVLRQCKVALKYPTNGLPLLLTGDTGTGKTFLVKQLYDYAKKESILPEEAPLEIFNCAEYADNPELLSSKLFGYKQGSFTGAYEDRKGIIDASDGGILFIDEVHRLSSESQEKLFYFIDEGKYKPIGENKEWSEAKVRLVFATTEEIDDFLLETFIRRIPIVTKVPSLDARGYQEKKEFLLYFLKNECKSTNRPIFISNELFHFLVRYSYTGNVGEMKNLVKSLVGNAFINLENDNDPIDINVSYLPKSMKNDAIKYVDMFSEERIEVYPDGTINDPDHNKTRNLFLKMNEKIVTYNEQLLNGKYTGSEYVNKCFDKLEQLITRHKSQNLIDPKVHTSVKDTMSYISTTMFEKNQIEFSHEAQQLIGDYLELVISVNKYDDVTTSEVVEILSILEEELSVPSSHAKLLKELLCQLLPYLSDRLSGFDSLMFTIIVTYYYNAFSIDKIQGVIICHGPTTASSLSQTANKMIGERVFHGIDMDLDVSFNEITAKLKRYLSLHETRNGTVILIDIGHTEDLRLAIQDRVEGPFAVIDNVSTKLALDVGFKIINKENISQLALKASESHYSECSVFEPEVPKEKALIISCQTGIGTANKLKDIFEENLPKSANIQLVVTDFKHLTTMKTNTTFFARYEVLGSIGTTDPKIQDVQFLGLDDIMSEEGINHLSRMFDEYLTAGEIHNLNNGLMKTLSLENLVTMLSILNPEKTIQLITEMMELWEEEFQLSIPNNLRTALYIHISCMIERVITRTYVENHSTDLSEFSKEHEYFIKVIKDGLAKFESIYHAEVDLGEIAYLHQLFSLNLNNFQY